MNRYCPICENTSDKFESFGFNPRQDALCPKCKSLERHRLSWLVIQKNLEKIDLKNKSFLHIAPEKVFFNKFNDLFNENYLTADLYDKNAKIKMDITDIQYPDKSFDYIYCSHVLEHIVDDKKAMRELHRVLKNDGWAILLVPIMTNGSTQEDFTITSKEDRLKNYGHPEHVRNYGYDYIDRLKESGWKVTIINKKNFLTSKEIEHMGITNAAGEIYLCKK